MANVAHSTLTGADLHEPKGVDSADAGQTYVADGAGSGTWTTPAASYATLIKTFTASNSSSIDFINGVSGVVLDSTYTNYIIEIEGMAPQTDAKGLKMLFGTGGGPTWTTNGYLWTCKWYFTNTTPIELNQGHDDDGIFLTYLDHVTIAPSNASSQNLMSTIRIANPANAALYTMSHWTTTYLYNGGTTMGVGGGGLDASGLPTATTGIRFIQTSGNIARGSFSLYGINK